MTVFVDYCDDSVSTGVRGEGDVLYSSFFYFRNRLTIFNSNSNVATGQF